MSKEINALKLYLDLMLLRYDHSFCYEIVTGDIDPDTVAVPPMLVQPFVENSIIHGIHPLPQKGEVSIEFQKEGKCLICHITDNGVGRTASHLQNRQK